MGEKQHRFAHILSETAGLVNSTTEAEAVLGKISENVARAFNAKGSSIMLLSPDRKLLLYTAAYGLTDSYIRKGPVAADRSMAAALEDQPVAVSHATEDERVQYREEAREEGILSILSVPIALGQEAVVGVLRVYMPTPYVFNNDDIYFVAGVANLSAVALDNARQFGGVRRDYTSLAQELIEWRAALGTEWLAGQTAGRRA